MKYCFTILFLFLLLSSKAQNDSLFNQIDNNGKKNGVWLVYLDKILNPVDSADSYFYAYEEYDHGDNIFRHYKNRNSDADSILYSDFIPTKGSPILLNGTFWCFTSDGRILAREEYKNGWPLFWKSYQYYAKNPNKCGFNEVLDWSKKYQNIERTYYYEEIWDDKVTYRGWFKKGKKGWKVYRIKD